MLGKLHHPKSVFPAPRTFPTSKRCFFQHSDPKGVFRASHRATTVFTAPKYCFSQVNFSSTRGEYGDRRLRQRKKHKDRNTQTQPQWRFRDWSWCFLSPPIFKLCVCEATFTSHRLLLLHRLPRKETTKEPIKQQARK